MNRIFARSEEAVGEFRALSRENIGVVGLSAGAGSTLVATGVAYLLSRDKRRSVAFVEAAEYARGGTCGAVGDGTVAGACGAVGDVAGGAEPRGLLYDAVGMDKRFALREYRDIFAIAEGGGSIRQVLNIDDRINWAVPTFELRAKAGYGLKPGAEMGSILKWGEKYGVDLRGQGTPERENDKTDPIGRARQIDRADRADRVSRTDTILKVINGIAGDTVICDIGSALSEHWARKSIMGPTTGAKFEPGFGTERESPLQRVLDVMDTVICVADPAPSKLLSGESRLRTIKQYEHRGGNCVYLVNKMSAGVDKRELYTFLGAKGKSPNFYELEALPLAELHAAEYSCRLPIESKSLRVKMKALHEITRAYLAL